MTDDTTGADSEKLDEWEKSSHGPGQGNLGPEFWIGFQTRRAAPGSHNG